LEKLDAGTHIIIRQPRQNIRRCRCGQELAARRRLCSTCLRQSRRTINRLNQRRWQQRRRITSN
jgi:hypothetical protein